MNRINDVVKKLFPKDFSELVPVKKHWWQNIDMSVFKTKWTIILGGLFIAVYFLAMIYYYNMFVVFETNATTDFEQVKVYLQRRKDLMVNLTQTVLDYAKHERMMFRYMADKRSDSLNQSKAIMSAIKNEGLLEKIKAGDDAGALAKIMALAEAYPELKLNSNFQKFMDALMNIEDKIAERRVTYNATANAYGTYVRQFPQLIYAKMFGQRSKRFPYIVVDSDVENYNRIKY
jgi:LemA protein